MAEVKKKGNTRVDVKEEELVFQCEWDDCEEQFCNIKTFLVHMGKHVDHYFLSVVNQDVQNNCFSCNWRECGTQILGNSQDFNRHVYFHAFHVKLKCIGELLIQKNSYPECAIDKQSRNWIPELPENLQCGWEGCGAISDNPVIFYDHVTHHCEEYDVGNHVNGGCACRWTDCDGRVKSKYKLREHLRSHTQEKVVACPTCGGLFANRTKFFDHLTRQKESSVYCYQCSHCNKRFATERLLRDHMRHHVNHYKCPFCDMTTPAPSSLRTHIKYRHTIEKPYRCAHCDHSAKSAADLRRHLDSHNLESVFKCHVEKCKYKAKTYASITNHYKKVHQIQDIARHTCHVCEQKFTRGHRLTQHLKKKHKFKWPPGHSKFRYKVDEDGSLRLQTVRYESIEVSEQILDQEHGGGIEMDSSDATQTFQTPQAHTTGSDENQENDHPTSTMSFPDLTAQDTSMGTCASSSKHSVPSSSSTSPQNTTLQPVSSLSCNSNPVIQNAHKILSTPSTSEDSNSTWTPILSMPDFSSDSNHVTNDVSASSTTAPLIKPALQSSLQSSQQGFMPELNETSTVPNQSIKFTFIDNCSQGESRVQNLCVDENGILVFSNKSGVASNKIDMDKLMTNQGGSSLAYDEGAYNLEMLGDVALQGENYAPRFQNL